MPPLPHHVIPHNDVNPQGLRVFQHSLRQQTTLEIPTILPDGLARFIESPLIGIEGVSNLCACLARVMPAAPVPHQC